MFNHSEKLQLLEEHLAFQRRQLASSINKKIVSRSFAAKKIAMLTEAVDDYRTGGGAMSEEQSNRIIELEARVKVLEELVGVGGSKLIRMKGNKYVIPPDTDQWRAWHRWFVEMNDPRCYKTGEIEVPSLWPEQ